MKGGIKKWLKESWSRINPYILFLVAVVLVGAILINLLKLNQSIFIKGISLGEAITIVILIIGLVLGIKETENALRPYVDVSVIFSDGGTKFQFFQKSNIPALVWLEIKLKENGYNINSEKTKKLLEEDGRLLGKKPFKIGLRKYITSAAFLKQMTQKVLENRAEKIEAIIKIFVAPVFRKQFKSFYEEKTYIFTKTNPQWIDDAWGIADEIDPDIEKRLSLSKSKKLQEVTDETQKTKL